MLNESRDITECSDLDSEGDRPSVSRAANQCVRPQAPSERLSHTRPSRDSSTAYSFLTLARQSHAQNEHFASSFRIGFTTLLIPLPHKSSPAPQLTASIKTCPPQPLKILAPLHLSYHSGTSMFSAVFPSHILLESCRPHHATSRLEYRHTDHNPFLPG